MCFCVCDLMLYSLSYIRKVIKYSFHLLLDIKRHNMYWEDYMAKIYYDPSAAGSFTEVDKLFRYFQQEGKYDISKYKVRKWLQRQQPYSLQRLVRRYYRRNKVVVAGIDDQWDADLMDMTKFKKENDGAQFVLLVIDIISKYVWMRPLKDKKGPTTARAFEDILREGRQPTKIRTDKGQEFGSKAFNNVLTDRNIQHLYSQNTKLKANFAERSIKTIKTRMYRYMTFKQSQRYIDRLQKFARSYNKTYHCTIDAKPELVNPNNEEEVRVSTFLSREEIPRKQTKRPYKFKVGDKVRISKIASVLDREYDEKWSGEIFIVRRRFLRNGIPVYTLGDYNAEAITGTFYQPELQKVDVRDEDTFKIEKILKNRGRGPNKHYFVKWLHWPKKFNSWINADDISA